HVRPAIDHSSDTNHFVIGMSDDDRDGTGDLSQSAGWLERCVSHALGDACRFEQLVHPWFAMRPVKAECSAAVLGHCARCAETYRNGRACAAAVERGTF